MGQRDCTQSHHYTSNQWATSDKHSCKHLHGGEGLWVYNAGKAVLVKDKDLVEGVVPQPRPRSQGSGASAEGAALEQRS